MTFFIAEGPTCGGLIVSDPLTVDRLQPRAALYCDLPTVSRVTKVPVSPPHSSHTAIK